jgi:hypothetical protein
MAAVVFGATPTHNTKSQRSRAGAREFNSQLRHIRDYETNRRGLDRRGMVAGQA